MKVIISFLYVLGISLTCQAESFYEQPRYKGWLWFEEPAPMEETQQLETSPITPAEAREQTEQFARELEDLRYVMFARPTVENVKSYRDKENEMWKRGMKVADSWMFANLKHPELFDHIEEPVNVKTVKLKRELDRQKNEKIIKDEFASKFTLVLFFRGDCRYCQEFEPVLDHFSKKYGFIIEAVSMDGGKSDYFKTVVNKELGSRLGIEATPTVVAVSKEGNAAFELIRGNVSLSELEEYTLLAVKYLESEKGYGQNKNK